MKPVLTTHSPAINSQGMYLAIALLIVLIVGAIAIAIAFRKLLRTRSPDAPEDWSKIETHSENASAFATASMQGVIEKLRAQEKELARLHLLAQERAQESERLTDEVTRNMPTGLLLVSGTGAISTTNPAAEEALGIRPLRYRSYKEIFGPDSDLARMLTACLREGRTFHRGEVDHTTRSGEIRHLGVTISPIRRAGRAGQSPHTEAAAPISGALCLMSDLTELAALQKQIRWKENLAALGEMSAGIAHEFKNALATISGYAQMIRNEAKPGDIRESSERILDQTRALTHVVTEFLRFAKPLEISYETVPMQAVVQHVADEMRDAAKPCRVEFSGAFDELPGDEALIRQALLNLVRNGAEAARGTGTSPEVTITGTIEELGGRQWQRVCVADNGPGIPEQELLKIFLPFYTTKSEGTGLGLAVVQKVALQHGGTIEARNRASGGAEFLLWLPLKQNLLASPITSDAARI